MMNKLLALFLSLQMSISAYYDYNEYYQEKPAFSHPDFSSETLEEQREREELEAYQNVSKVRQDKSKGGVSHDMADYYNTSQSEPTNNQGQLVTNARDNATELQDLLEGTSNSDDSFPNDDFDLNNLNPNKSVPVAQEQPAKKKKRWFRRNPLKPLFSKINAQRNRN